MSKRFWFGVALACAGIILMSLPEKPCVDCDDTIDEVSDIEIETEGPLND